MPVVVAVMIGGAVLLTLGLIASAIAGAIRTGAPPDVPELRLAAPAPGDSLDNPVTLQFRTRADLRLGSGGWSAGGLHLHAMVDDREIMPAAADITGAAGTYAWQLPPLAPGTRRIHLNWADRSHGNLNGPTDTVVVHVRP